jgi:hypothetical protein
VLRTCDVMFFRVRRCSWVGPAYSAGTNSATILVLVVAAVAGALLLRLPLDRIDLICVSIATLFQISHLIGQLVPMPERQELLRRIRASMRCDHGSKEPLGQRRSQRADFSPPQAASDGRTVGGLAASRLLHHAES